MGVEEVFSNVASGEEGRKLSGGAGFRGVTVRGVARASTAAYSQREIHMSDHWSNLVKVISSVLILSFGAFLLVGQELKPHAPRWTDGSNIEEHHCPPIATIRGGVEWSRSALLESPPPAYPEKAKKKKLQGRVKLQVLVGQEGSVLRLDTVSGNPVLAQAAIDAVQHWKYHPTYLNGERVRVLTMVEVAFAPDSTKSPQKQ